MNHHIHPTINMLVVKKTNPHMVQVALELLLFGLTNFEFLQASSHGLRLIKNTMRLMSERMIVNANKNLDVTPREFEKGNPWNGLTAAIEYNEISRIKMA